MASRAPQEFSPTDAVRHSCSRWLAGGRSTASINHEALDKFATEITESIISNQSLEVTEWDADGWHYTGAKYKNNGYSDEVYELMRMERVALYILALDAMNFCFWPLSSEAGKSNAKNCLEYEHLAIALRKVAEADDEVAHATDRNEVASGGIVRAASSYALSPTNLSALTPTNLRSMLQPHFPPSSPESAFELPNIEVRCKLLNELGRGLAAKHDGSALSMIAKAGKSADKLTGIILDSFPGFRDFVDTNDWNVPSSSEICWGSAKDAPSVIHFYKRAQIAVADIWAALGRQQRNSISSARTQVCQFVDMNNITTFPDYRVPQILRHVNVLQYEAPLADLVDGKEELPKGGLEEVSIRAGTVVAVEHIVSKVRENILNVTSNDGSGRTRADLQKLADGVSAVTIDWYLWQKGEKLDRQNLLEPHHRVRTTFY